MGQIFNRIDRLVKAEINHSKFDHSEPDPEKVLEQALLEMQEDLLESRQAVRSAVASQRRIEQQYNQAKNEVNKWQRNAQLSLQKGDEDLSRQALELMKSFAETANMLKANLDQQDGQIDTLKRSLFALENKVSEAHTKKDMLKARLSAAKAKEQLKGTVGRLGTSTAMTAFEQMEEKVLMQEARAKSAQDLIGTSSESQFAALDSGTDVDDELAAMKAQLGLGLATPQSDVSKSVQVVNAELEELKKQLDQI